MADHSTKPEERWMAGGECLHIRPTALQSPQSTMPSSTLSHPSDSPPIEVVHPEQWFLLSWSCPGLWPAVYETFRAV